MHALPRSPAKCKLTATWQLSLRPIVPEYWRCTPTEWLPFFGNPVSSTTIASSAGSSASTLRASRRRISSSDQGLTVTHCCRR